MIHKTCVGNLLVIVNYHVNNFSVTNKSVVKLITVKVINNYVSSKSYKISWFSQQIKVINKLTGLL